MVAQDYSPDEDDLKFLGSSDTDDFHSVRKEKKDFPCCWLISMHIYFLSYNYVDY
jgi:hypothetical protein